MEGFQNRQEMAADIIRRQEKLASDRSTFDSHWAEVAERVLPHSNYFVSKSATPGEKKSQKVFDSTAPLALERFSAALESMLVPRTARWHGLRSADADANESDAVREYLDAVVDVLFQMRYSPKAKFSSQIHEVFMSLGAFGTGCLFVDDDVADGGLRYKSIHLSEIYFCENASGAIDTVHRLFELTARQALQKFGGDTLPEKITKAAKEEPDKMFEFIHCVQPREERDAKRLDAKNMRFASYYVAKDDKMLVRESGYDTMPYAISRYVTAPRETYGRSPAMMSLPDIKMVNEIKKTNIRAAHRAVDPVILMADDGVLSSMDMRPGAVNMGGLDANGNQLVKEFGVNSRLDFGIDLMNQTRESINSAFLVDLFMVLVESPGMTATEAMIRAQEKGALMAPTMGRQQSELLGVIIERELDILAKQGRLPEMPQELLDLGGEVDIEYTSPLNRMQRSEEGVGIMRTLEAVMPLAQIDPGVLDVYDIEKVARVLSDVNGVPAKVIRDPKQVDEVRAQRQKAQQMQAALQAAPVAAGAVKDMAAAGEMMNRTRQGAQ